jgi:hypothetical protein
MLIRKMYTLYINTTLRTAYFGNLKFGCRIGGAKFGKVIDCNLSDLKHNLRILAEENYLINKRTY